MFRMSHVAASTCLVLSVLTPATVFGIGEDKTEDEIAIELSHPAGDIGYIDNRFKYRWFQGDLPEAGSQSAFRYELEFYWPFKLKNGKNFIVRPMIPINGDQPIYWTDGIRWSEWQVRQASDTIATDGYFKGGHDHLDDATIDLAYGGVSDSGFIAQYGIEFSFITSQDVSSAREQNLLGPEITLGQVTDWGVIGGTIKHMVDVAGEDHFDTSFTNLKLFFAYSLGGGWQITSNPEIEYDHEGGKGNKLALPLGGGASKTTRWGRMPVKMDLEAYYYVASPDLIGPELMVTFRIAPVVGGPFFR